MGAAATPLIPCTDCGNDISRRAPSCPHCGREIRPTPWGLVFGAARWSVKTALIYVAVIAVLFAVASLFRS
jgi:predicted amidophosphoribosyltransferase